MLVRFCCQTKPRFDSFFVPIDSRSDIFADSRAVFEAMTRSPAREPHVLEFRMTIDQEIAIRSVFVLAHARIDQRRVMQIR